MADELLDVSSAAGRVRVTVGSGGEKLTANPSVEQRVAVLGHPRDKWEAFLQLVEPFRKGGGEAATRVIVFCNTKKDVNGIGEHLYNDGFSVDTCSGDRTQRERERVIQSFRDGAVTMVIATDVAARGLDVKGVEYVVHYQLPRSAEVYVHRSGRTARGAGATGASIALIEPADVKGHRRLCRELERGEAGFPEVSISPKLLPRVREAVSIARQLDKAAHLESRHKAGVSWRKRLAQEMDLDFSDEEDRGDADDDVAARRMAGKRKQQEEQLRASLKALLARLERPTSDVPLHEIARSKVTWG